jgi:hypothetical protein
LGLTGKPEGVASFTFAVGTYEANASQRSNASMPLLLRALFGEKRKSLEAEIAPHVARNVAFFLAACRNGGVD